MWWWLLFCGAAAVLVVAVVVGGLRRIVCQIIVTTAKESIETWSNFVRVCVLLFHLHTANCKHWMCSLENGQFSTLFICVFPYSWLYFNCSDCVPQYTFTDVFLFDSRLIRSILLTLHFHRTMDMMSHTFGQWSCAWSSDIFECQPNVAALRSRCVSWVHCRLYSKRMNACVFSFSMRKAMKHTKMTAFILIDDT